MFCIERLVSIYWLLGRVQKIIYQTLNLVRYQKRRQPAKLRGIEPRSATLKVDGSTLPRGAVLTTSSNRNLGDANSLFLDLKNGELHRADFIEGSCSNRVLEQVRARRGNGEVRAPESEPAQPGLRFESKPAAAPQQATDGANQPAEQPRARNDGGAL